LLDGDRGTKRFPLDVSPIVMLQPAQFNIGGSNIINVKDISAKKRLTAQGSCRVMVFIKSVSVKGIDSHHNSRLQLIQRMTRNDRSG
jgi:hypothetical protein